jgi:hypothetical protein
LHYCTAKTQQQIPAQQQLAVQPTQTPTAALQSLPLLQHLQRQQLLWNLQLLHPLQQLLL